MGRNSETNSLELPVTLPYIIGGRGREQIEAIRRCYTIRTRKITVVRNRRDFRRYVPWLGLAAVLLCLTVLPVSGQQAALPAEDVAPDFTLPDLQGKEVRLSQYRGKVVLLNFWATWCAPCRLEMPTMEQAYRKYKGKGFEVVAVSVDAGPKSAVKHFLQELDLSFQVVLDPKMEILRQFRSFSLPTTFLIDRRGVIRLRELGYRDWTDPASTKLLAGLLSEGAS